MRRNSRQVQSPRFCSKRTPRLNKVLAAVETINPRMPATLDAAAELAMAKFANHNRASDVSEPHFADGRVGILPEVKDNKQPVAPTLNEDLHTAPSKDLASHSSSSSNMKNPIPLITNTISEKTKTAVDFKTGKATETEKGGFFIKIGKFEVSHKSSKKK